MLKFSFGVLMLMFSSFIYSQEINNIWIHSKGKFERTKDKNPQGEIIWYEDNGRITYFENSYNSNKNEFNLYRKNEPNVKLVVSNKSIYYFDNNNVNGFLLFNGGWEKEPTIQTSNTNNKNNSTVKVIDGNSNKTLNLIDKFISQTIGSSSNRPINVFQTNQINFNYNEYKALTKALSIKKNTVEKINSIETELKNFNLPKKIGLYELIESEKIKMAKWLYNQFLSNEVYSIDKKTLSKFLKKDFLDHNYNIDVIDYTNKAPILSIGSNGEVLLLCKIIENVRDDSQIVYSRVKGLSSKMIGNIKKNGQLEDVIKKNILYNITGLNDQYFALEDSLLNLKRINDDLYSDKFKFTDNDGLYFGSIINNNLSGFGILFNSLGDTIFIGSWKDNFPNLEDGKLFQYSSSKNETYLKNDYNIFISYSPKGEVYCGNHKNNIRSGQGLYLWTSNDLYKGTWQEGNRTGKGTFLWSNGDKYEGDFISGDRTGFGKYIFSTGDIWEGQWQNSKFTGLGKQISKNGSVKEGLFEEGRFTKSKEQLESERILEEKRKEIERIENQKVEEDRKKQELALKKHQEQNPTYNNGHRKYVEMKPSGNFGSIRCGVLDREFMCWYCGQCMFMGRSDSGYDADCPQYAMSAGVRVRYGGPYCSRSCAENSCMADFGNK